MASKLAERINFYLDAYRSKRRIKKLSKKYSENEQKIYYAGVRDAQNEQKRLERKYKRSSSQNNQNKKTNNKGR